MSCCLDVAIRDRNQADAPRPVVAANILDVYAFIDHPAWVACLFMNECDAGCPQDLDRDGSVGAFDLTIVLGSWGPCEWCSADFNGDDVVNAADLAQLLGAWGMCP